ncbi:transferase family domain-containing protein [Trichoderma velutinum]
MPKIYVLIAEVFSLPETVDNNAIVETMTAGLQLALAQYPILAGTVEMDEVSGRMWVTKNRDTATSLHIKHMLEEGTFPSYKELERKNFPANLVNANKLLPRSVTEKQLFSPLGDNNEDGIAVAAFQLNFIRGGLIIGAAIHHSVTDGPGFDGFLVTWAENSAALAAGGHSIPPKQQSNLYGSLIDVEKPTPQQMAELKISHQVAKDAGGPMPPPPDGYKMPSLSPQMWHFPKHKLGELKGKASSKDGSSDWISTFDSIMALLWSSITRARLDLLRPDLDSKAVLIHAVDTRKVWDPPPPDRFLSVGSVPARSEPLSIRDIVNPENLPRIAGLVRSATKAQTPQHLMGLLQWIAGHEDRRWLQLNVNSFLGMDLVASSWQGMTAYKTHDFGFGLPSALRWPSPAFDGFVFVYPDRSASKSSAWDEGIEVCICLEAGCQERLMRDEVLLAYAQPRGL